MRTLAVLLAALTAACNGGPDLPATQLPPPQARIAPDLLLTLPVPPNYPDTRTAIQLVRSRYLGVEIAVEAVLSLSPDQAVIVMTVLGGPRLATITWDQTGVHSERAPFAPEAAPVENILSDIFVTLWPPEIVAAALPDGVSLSVEANGVRVLRRGGELIMEAGPEAADPRQILVRNHALGYEVRIMNRGAE